MKIKSFARPIAATLLLSTSSIAMAQNTSDTFIISAPGPAKSADELIGNATSLDRAEILGALAGSLGDTLDSEPGVASTFFGPGASRPVLRGLGAERVLVLTNGIGVIDASTASPDHQVAADGIDAERIEILRGPAALAYGGQAIGGVVNVIDGLIVETLPDDPAAVDAFSAFNTVNDGTELAASGQFTSGPFVFTLSASQRDFENYDVPGFVESSQLRALEEAEHEEEDDHDEDEEHEEEEARDTVENSFVETDTIAAGLSWVGENAFLGAAVRRQTSLYGLPGSSHGHHEEEEGEDHDEEEEEEENPFIDLEQTRIDIRGGVTLEDSFITNITGTIAIGDYEHTEFEAPGEAGTIYTSEGVESRVEIDHVLGDFKGAAGLQHVDKELSAEGDEAFITPTSTQSMALFIYETKEWSNGVGIEGGLRVEQVELDNRDAGAVDFDLVSGAFGVHSHSDSGWFVGAQLAYTERAPNESELFALGPHLATNQYEVGDAGLDKESGLNLEGTVRWSSENISIGANIFTTQFSDFIYLTPGVTLDEGVEVSELDELPVFVFAQEDADFVGGEIYGDLKIDDGMLGAVWALDFGLDFVSAELSSGADVPYIPPLTFSTGVAADWGKWSLGSQLTVAESQRKSGEGILTTDGYTTLDLNGAIALSEFGIGAEGTEFFVDVRNVTDEEVRYATSVLKDLLPAPGRNVRVGVKLSF